MYIVSILTAAGAVIQPTRNCTLISLSSKSAGYYLEDQDLGTREYENFTVYCKQNTKEEEGKY